jgi:cell division inhibitor SepF
MAQEQYDDYVPPRGLWARMKERFLGSEEEDEYQEVEEEMPVNPSETRKRASLRIDQTRQIRVAVRLNATVFEDAKQAADGFKSGEQQIVNLERAAPAMAERILDFLSGVTYALDGNVERIGEKVFLFAPANVYVNMDNRTEANPNA